MSIEDADFLQRMIEEQQTVTNQHEQWVQTQVALWRALRESDSGEIESLIGWPSDRTYYIDPLASKISEAFADLLFGQNPTITSAQTAVEKEKGTGNPKNGKPQDGPTLSNTGDNQIDIRADMGPDFESIIVGSARANETDQEWLDDLVEANDLPSELRRAEEICSSEGEVWWRIYVDRGQMPYPIMDWHSRSHVRPLFRGRRLISAAFVSDIYREDVAGYETVMYKYVQIQTGGYVRNLLYRGTLTQLGQTVDLTERPETAELEPEWSHGLPMLCGRIPNKLGSDHRYGISDYSGVKELILALNEATTIGAENARLVAKKRVVVPAESLNEDGRFDAGEDVLVAGEPLDQELGSTSTNNRFAVLEYTFDAQALLEYKDDLAATILTRVGIAQQFVNISGRSGAADGAAASGTALRLRLIPTTLAAQGKARYWDDALPKQMLLMQLVDSLDESQGGFGRPWAMPAEPPSIERPEPLPQDEEEEVNRHVMAVTGEIESRMTAIQDMHPDWSEDQVQDELDQIKKELSTFGAPAPTPGAPAAGPGAGFPEQKKSQQQGPPAPPPPNPPNQQQQQGVNQNA